MGRTPGRKPKKMSTVMKRATMSAKTEKTLKKLSTFSSPKKKRKKKDDCFISSICFGYNSSETDILRNWRDSFLTKTTWGINFIKWYYRNGYVISVFLKKNEILKKIVKIFLFGFIKFLKISKK